MVSAFQIDAQLLLQLSLARLFTFAVPRGSDFARLFNWTTQDFFDFRLLQDVDKFSEAINPLSEQAILARPKCAKPSLDYPSQP
jgi:hypothetical protein